MSAPHNEAGRLQDMLVRTERLGHAIASFWKTRGPDPVHGGFHGTLDENGRPVDPRTKAVIPLARHLWAFTTWYEEKEQTPAVKAICDDLYAFLLKHFLDPQTGEYHWMTDAQGRLVNEYNCLYAQSFVIYAFSQYSRVFGHRHSLEQAMTCFRSIDRRAHDAKRGGYDQRQETFWVKGGAHKETNTHIHLMEAYTALTAAGGDPLVRERLAELLDLIADTLTQPSGYVHTQFSADWEPVTPPQVSYGHDLETAWLLFDAARVLGKAEDKTLCARIVKIASLSGVAGWDAERGGYFQYGIPGGPVENTDKVWWVQAEAVLGLLRLFFLTRNSAWLEKTEKTLDWIERYQVNRGTGEWHDTLDRAGRLVGTPLMGHEWKASYHTLRAMVLAGKWIRGESG
jgi:cellobiose epimerase